MSANTIETRACWQPWDSLNVAADGKVYPCCVINVDLEIGNLNTAPLESIVSSDKAVMLKRKILAGDIVDLPCHECCNAPMVPTEEFKQAIRDRFFAPTDPEQQADVICTEEPIALTDNRDSDAPAQPVALSMTLKNRIKRRVIRIIEHV